MTRVSKMTGGGGCGAKGSKLAMLEINSSSNNNDNNNNNNQDSNKQLSLLDLVVSAVRKSMVSKCRQHQEVITPVHQMEIGRPTDVKHLTHITFDKFHGFLGLPSQAPTHSVSLCGVSANSMHWSSYDIRCNSVPRILLLMQERLYALGGLKAEGIFRVNPENGKEEYLKAQLDRGIVPQKIDVHCLAGLIKAWFRELPSGVLDGLLPQQVLQCNKEDEFVELIEQLKPTESCLLKWAIDLMADVVELEESNKMNATNIAMVFAPNMTKMSDPLTALMHAVQVMNLLKTLIVKKLRERKEAAQGSEPFSSNFTICHHKTEKYYGQCDMDSSCESTAQVLDKNDEGSEKIESHMSEAKDCFLRPLEEKESAKKDGLRKQLERILCSRENGSPRNISGSTFYEDSWVSFQESRLGSIAFRSSHGCKMRNRHGSRDCQYLLTNNVFSQYSPI